MKRLIFTTLFLLTNISYAQQVKTLYSCNVVGQGTANDGKETEKMYIDPIKVPVDIREDASKRLLYIGMNGSKSKFLEHATLYIPNDGLSKNLSDSTNYKVTSTQNMPEGTIYENAILNKINGALLWNTVYALNTGVTIKIHIEGKCYKQ